MAGLGSRARAIARLQALDASLDVRLGDRESPGQQGQHETEGHGSAA